MQISNSKPPKPESFYPSHAFCLREAGGEAPEKGNCISVVQGHHGSVCAQAPPSTPESQGAGRQSRLLILRGQPGQETHLQGIFQPWSAPFRERLGENRALRGTDGSILRPHQESIWDNLVYALPRDAVATRVGTGSSGREGWDR